ncbi:hypothetical protein DES49_0307 [Halospina denitrificans]|uniref:Uncharacterized protein n=1 Tax=Halospina denitrificans TaxID=332522 RepID=A0A4R7K2E4_9GAMM|nr:hypothetical protein DES49_0307 [Halospina denitrificans]
MEYRAIAPLRPAIILLRVGFSLRNETQEKPVTGTNVFPQQAFAPEVAARAANCFDILVLKSRMTDSAQCLLRAMGVHIDERPSTGMPGPPVYHLWAPEPRPSVTWLDPHQADAFIDALLAENHRFRSPEWVDLMLCSHRAGTLRDMDEGIELGEQGIDVGLVLRDLLHYPSA